MSDEKALRHLRIVRGEPTPEELAALAAIVSAGGSDEAGAEPPVRGRWNDPAATHRRPWQRGPGGWRAALR
ncbi:MAG TPA: acyl-CoA carboxylase subunit epsilon [Jatrophihabitantaceae bacterium]|nr:acyl-CoA carboxylase subunit epsilon [Jatrophihabitantaceae bacterium]